MDEIDIGPWHWDLSSPRYMGAATIAGFGIVALIFAPKSWKKVVTLVTIAAMAAWIMFWETVAAMVGIPAT